MAGRLVAAAAVFADRLSLVRWRSQAAPLAACGLPEIAPVWIDYGDGSLTPDVRAVFTRPGVVVATSGPVVPAAFRAGGAATALFVRTLPTLVGEPADAASTPKRHGESSQD
jgi:hypothetical protein